MKPTEWWEVKEQLIIWSISHDMTKDVSSRMNSEVYGAVVSADE